MAAPFTFNKNPLEKVVRKDSQAALVDNETYDYYRSTTPDIRGLPTPVVRQGVQLSHEIRDYVPKPCEHL